MTSIPASRNARAMIFAPRSWPSRPGLATTTRVLRAMAWRLNDQRVAGYAREVAARAPNRQALAGLASARASRRGRPAPDGARRCARARHRGRRARGLSGAARRDRHLARLRGLAVAADAPG